MREYINSKLELYVQLSELEDAVTSQIGFENYFFLFWYQKHIQIIYIIGYYS